MGRLLCPITNSTYPDMDGVIKCSVLFTRVWANVSTVLRSSARMLLSL